MALYNQLVMEHFTNPRNVGELADANGVALVTNFQCGDTTKLFLKIAGDIIVDCRWQTKGCGAAIATSSAASEMVKGMPLARASTLTKHDIASALGGLPRGKVHCSILFADALREAIDDYRRRQGAPGL